MTIRREHSPSAPADDLPAAFIPLLDEWRGGHIDRRTFLAHVAALLSAAALPSTMQAETGTAVTGKTSEPALVDNEPWHTLAAVQDHLFPTTPDAPGAREIHATAYLKAALAAPDMDPNDSEFIKNGVTWLNDVTQQQHRAAFADLDEDRREAVLRRIEKTGAGRRWLSLLLLYTFEALLSDPIYGGNPDGTGWQWLEHQAGFPRPPARYTYHELKKL